MSPSSSSSSSRTPLVIGLVAVVVAILAVVAIILATSDDGDSTASGNGQPTSGQPAEFRGEARDVEIEGEVLPPHATGAVPDPAIGLRPPLLVAEAVDGVVHTISPDIAGTTMLVFLAHWCPACNNEVPSIVALNEAGAFPDELNVYGVLTGMDPTRPGFPPSRWLERLGWPFVAVADGLDLDESPARWAASHAFGLTAYPYVVLITDGIVVDRWSGELNSAEFAARVAAAVS